MLIKLIGGILIIVASGAFGIGMGNKYGGRPKELKRLRILLQMLETEIIYGATPLPFALANVASKADNSLSHFFQDIAEGLIRGSFYSVKEAWDKAVDTSLQDTYLGASDKELLKSFGGILGASDSNDQQKHFKLFYKQLEQQEDLAEEDRRKNEKMYRSLGFLFGIVVFIVLV